MTRRSFVRAAASGVWTSSAVAPVTIPVHRITDARIQCSPEQLHDFWRRIWPEAVRELGRGGIQLQVTDGPGEIKSTAGDRPNIVGLRHGAINVVITGHIPMKWDEGRGLAGVTA